jgi:hypothetical protein
LVRLALEKWCSFKPKKNKSVEKKNLFEEEDLMLLKKKKSPTKSPGKVYHKNGKNKEVENVQMKETEIPLRER